MWILRNKPVRFKASILQICKLHWSQICTCNIGPTADNYMDKKYKLQHLEQKIMSLVTENAS